MKPTKVLFMLPYPLNESPSQRFRLEQYLDFMASKGLKPHTQSFLPPGSWRLFYSKGYILRKAQMLLNGYIKRIMLLLSIAGFDFVFIHREAAPIGPPVFEWLIARMFGKKIIYDFDDAIWLTDKKNEGRLERSLRSRNKVASICKWSYKISCGNEYLRQYAQQFNPNAVLNPTTIDAENLHNPARYRVGKNSDRIVVGWTGSHSTLKYLYLLQGVLQKIQHDHPHVDLLIIADRRPEVQFERLTFKYWTRETEITDLLLADIGIMPLPNDPWALGKCGFKALQYMALEIPAVVSAVGVNNIIIENERNGFLCSTDEDWLEALDRLIEDAVLRKRTGQAGRQTVIDNYSVMSNSSDFLSLFE
jgi:glycosyltransferase involved in cell wall biosynthesis